MEKKIEWSDKEWDEYANKLRRQWGNEPIAQVMQRHNSINTKIQDTSERLKLEEEQNVLGEIIRDCKCFKEIYEEIDELRTTLMEKEEQIKELERQLKKHKHTDEGDAYLMTNIGLK
jgi:vacuolar-type H+-ATPase subunit I/STV1